MPTGPQDQQAAQEQKIHERRIQEYGMHAGDQPESCSDAYREAM
jgi:hypothetical protein